MKLEFFKLNEGCFIVDGLTSSCIYNTISGDMIRINKEIAEFLKQSEDHQKINNINKYTHDILLKLEKLNIGSFRKKSTYINKLSTYDESKTKQFCEPNHSIKSIFIEITNKCNINCLFCNENETTLFRKTGCKRWPLKNNYISIEKLKQIIYQAKKLGCENIFFIGGEPLLELSKLKQLITYSVEIGIQNNIIFTNGLMLNDEIIEFLSNNKTKLIIQIYSFQNEIYKRITGINGLGDILIQNLNKLQLSNMDISLNLLINRFNEIDVENIIKNKSVIYDTYKLSNLYIEYIYPNGNNEYYSEKYYSNMFDKTKSLNKVYLNKFYSNKYKHNCYGYQLAITADGEVIPCIMSRNIILGNIANEDLISILNKNEYKEVSRITKNLINKCSNCELKYGCFDCRALEQAGSGDLYGIKYCNKS